jgi:hypothetical protein
MLSLFIQQTTSNRPQLPTPPQSGDAIQVPSDRVHSSTCEALATTNRASTDPPETLPVHPKRTKTTHTFSATQTDFQMEEFLLFSHIPIEDTQTRSVITSHALHHWSLFKCLSVRRLRKLGFQYGPIYLLKEGASKAVKHIKRSRHN